MFSKTLSKSSNHVNLSKTFHIKKNCLTQNYYDHIINLQHKAHQVNTAVSAAKQNS